MRLLLAWTLALPLLASETYPEPRFRDPERVRKLSAAFREIDALFERHSADRRIPGMAWGIVIDGRVAHVRTTGVRERTTNSPVTPQTAFRIASMTKSFTALAILKLRDEGKVSLEDPVSKWIPQFASMPMATRDTAPIRLRQLLTHGAGFPEDNPWGDQQLGISDRQLDTWLKQGLPFSTAPDTSYEYSNYGFGLLGRVITKASGMPYEQYLARAILQPLGMKSSTLEPASAPAAQRAIGYRLKPDGVYAEEPPLPHGAFGAMGGLVTTAEDLGRYVAFQLSAWPPRDDAEAGPVRRSSVREMNHLWRPSNLNRTSGDAEFSGYGFGLRISGNCAQAHMVGHGGGLPGFGSYMLWLPEHGVGFFGMANLTYASPLPAIRQAITALQATGGLVRRELPVAPALATARERIFELWKNWDEGKLQKLAAMNLLLDEPAAQRRAQASELQTEVGACSSAGEVEPENWLRGHFLMTCERGNVQVTFTMAPTQPPAVQYLRFRKAVPPENPRGASAGLATVTCRE